MGCRNSGNPGIAQRCSVGQGFSLLQLLMSMVLLAIVAVVAMPASQFFAAKSRARSASTDLMSLGANLENTFKKTRAYPIVTTTNTADTMAATFDWSPGETTYFSYKLVSTARAYTLTAQGTGQSLGCDLTLDQNNTRTITAQCGLSSW